MDGGNNFSSWNIDGDISVISVSCNGESVVVGTNEGVYLSRDGGAFFTHLNVSLKDERVNSVYIDKTTNLIWVSSFRGVDLLNFDGTFLNSWGVGEGLSSPFVNSAIPTPLGGFITGTSDGLTIRYPGGESLYNRSLIDDHSYGASTLWIDNKDQLYYSTDKGFYVSGIRGENFKLKNKNSGLKSNFIFKAILDKDGNGWAATPYGVAVSNNKQLSFFRNFSKTNGLDAGAVFDLYVDLSDDIYLATANGIYLKKIVENKIEFEQLKGSEDVTVSTLFVDSLGVIYAGTSRGLAELSLE
jgi:ligand-binding sensor domain-containing protein